MGYYFEILLLPDPEFKSTVLMNALYSKLHKKMHDLTLKSVGVDFPKAKLHLGEVLRLHSDKESLDSIGANWLGGLAGYCQVGDVQQVPEGAKHRTVSRWQHNMSESDLRRLIRRAEGRGQPMTEDEIKAYRAKMFKQQLTDLPYIELQSGSNGHKHRRYIKFGELQNQAVEGEFDTFGLSKTATVPWF